MGTKYSSVTVSGYNASPPADDGSQVASNQVTWAKSKTKLGDPLNTAIASINSTLVTALDASVRAVTSADTATAADNAKTIQCTAALSVGYAVSLGDAATMAAGYIVTVHNRASSVGDVTVNLASATNTLNNVTNGTRLLQPGSALTFIVASPTDGYLISSSDNALKSPLYLAIAGVLKRVEFPNYDHRVMSQTKGADIASAATINLDTATGDLVDVTGVVTVTAITLAEGKQATVRFAGALTLTNGASLVLPGAANITTVAGDVALFRGYAAGVVRCVSYMPITLPPTRPILVAEQPASGTSIDFTGIPAWAKRITVNLIGVSTTGTSNIVVQLGDSGGIEATGYAGCGGSADLNGVSPTNFAASFLVVIGPAAAGNYSAQVTLVLQDASDNAWTCSGTASRNDTATLWFFCGHKATSAVLDRVRVTTAGGAETFDAGIISILYG